LCRPAASSRDGVSGRELDLYREHSRISPDSFGIHGHTRIPQDGLSQTAAGRCPSVVVPHDSFPTLSSRRLENEAHCRADALATLFLFADSRSAPDPRAATSFVHGAGDSRRGRTLRDARVQGHCGLGPKPRAEIAGALRLPSRTRSEEHTSELQSPYDL